MVASVDANHLVDWSKAIGIVLIRTGVDQEASNHTILSSRANGVPSVKRWAVNTFLIVESAVAIVLVNAKFVYKSLWDRPWP